VIASAHADAILAAAKNAGVPAILLGQSGGDGLTLADGTTISVAELAHENARFFPEWMDAP
jgi:phosphoribosylformylglycinamidine synthase